MKFIRLTGTGGVYVWVNMARVASFNSTGSPAATHLWFGIESEGECQKVKESPQEIMKLIEQEDSK